MPETTALDELRAAERREAIRSLWTDGDYPRIGELFAPAAHTMLEHLDLDGRDLLDAGTGTGNVALTAARRGARVRAFDLTPRLLDEARRRAGRAGADIEFREGDLLDIPWPDGSFDLVCSCFAAFLSGDAARCLTELVRVSRPGGRIVTTAWSEHSIFFRMTQVAREHDPQLIEVRDPGPFADRDLLRELAMELPVVAVHVQEHPMPLGFGSATAAMGFFERTSGPVQRMASAFGERWISVRRDIVDDWEALADTGEGGVLLPATFCLATCQLADAPPATEDPR